jgi:epoxide hydrolase 4
MIVRLFILVIALVAGAPLLAKPDPAVVHANSLRQGAIGYEEGWFGSGDTRLHYVESGKGPLIILYHGFPSFWYSWFDQMEMLKTRYRVVAVDGLGAGLSAKPVSPELYRIDRLAAQIDALARHLDGERRFTLIGHDWGAALAFAFAQGYPERLNAVIGMSAPPYNLFLDLVRADPEQQARSRYMQVFQSLTLADIDRRGLGEQIWKQSYQTLIEKGALSKAEGELFRTALADPHAINGGMNWYRANIPPFEKISHTTKWPTHAAKIRAPALLIWGDADQTFVPGFLRRMPAIADSMTIKCIPKVNHWTTMESPAEANAAIAEFLREIDERYKRTASNRSRTKRAQHCPSGGCCRSECCQSTATRLWQAH